MKFDTRKSRRLRLKRPAAAMTAHGTAELIDIAPASLGLLHEWSAEKGDWIWVEFSWSGRLIRLDCEVRTCRYSRADGKYRSGLTVRGGLSAADYKERVRREIRKMQGM